MLKTTKLFLILLLAGQAFLHSCSEEPSGMLETENLLLEYESGMTVIDIPDPRFTWTFRSSARNKFQSAYRIIVASTPDLIERDQGDLWDSGKVNGGQSLNVVYQGNPLASFSTYYWKVQTWDESGKSAGWSKTATFETGLLDEAEWQASWIGDGRPMPEQDEDFYEVIPAPCFMKNIEVPGPVSRARLYIAGLGYYEAYLNGSKIGDHVLDPGWTNYGKEVLYATYDVSDHLEQGINTMGVLLGNGWYNPLPLGLFRRFNLRKYLTIGPPSFIAHLRIEMENGETRTYVSDGSWKWKETYILKNDVYLGEVQDGRMKANGREFAEAGESQLRDVAIVDPPGGELNAQMTPPIRITARLTPVGLTEPMPGVYVYDLGQNFAGWINFKVHEPAGTRIEFLYGEILNEDGTVNGMTTVAGHIKEIWNLSGGPGAPGTAFQKDQYIANGAENDFFQQHFTFHAFRYVQVTGLEQAPEPGDLVGLRLSASLGDAGEIHTSNPALEDIQEMVEWTFLSNVFSVQSDCPGREKFGYGADIVTSAEAFIFNYDMAQFYRKTVNDFANDVRPNGGMPECAPYNGIDTKGFGGGTGPIGWQLAYPFVQKCLYDFYGDRRIIEEHYEMTKGMVDFLRSQAENHLIYHGISDHVSVDPKPEALTSGAFYYHHVKLLAEFAGILDKKSDEKQYLDLAGKIRNAFNATYLNDATGSYDTLVTQITQVFPLYYDLVPDDLRDDAFEVLVREIVDTHNGHLSTGIFGTKMLFDVLRIHNRNDLAYEIVNQEGYPGYIHMLNEGATTLWENWEKPDQNSWNHPMFGSVSEWYYRSLLGINPAPGAEGFDKVYLRPSIPGDLTQAEGSYNSVRGTILSKWERKDDQLNWEVIIPPNISGTLHIPATDQGSITVNGIAAEDHEDLRFIAFKDGYGIYEAGNGHFSIRSK